MDELKNKQLVALRESILVWEHISTMEEEYDESLWEFKDRATDLAGLDRVEFGCPLCESFLHTSDCPIGKCGDDDGGSEVPCEEENYPYELWRKEVTDERGLIIANNTELAKAFLEELKALLKRLENSN